MKSSRHSYLSRIGTAVPAFAYSQNDLYAAMTRVLPLEVKQSKALRGLYKHSGIDTRYSVLPDFLPTTAATEALYPQTPEGDFPPLSARMAVYHREALPLALEAIQQSGADLQQITHLIAVSCTGMAAPGLDLMLLRALELPAHTHRTCVHYMGCYAALHGLKQADSICRADPDAQVLVVCLELCTLHFQPDTSWDNLTSSLLFADGAAAVVVTGKPLLELSEQPDSRTPVLEIAGFYSEVALEGWDEMSWNPDEKGFLMRLGRGVPFMLQNHAKVLIQRALERHTLALEDICDWAIHPGGRLILDLLVRELNLEPNALDASREVLKAYGNMSSPTVLFVLRHLQRLQQKRSVATDAFDSQAVFAAAFGPGLTMETALMRWLPATSQ